MVTVKGWSGFGHFLLWWSFPGLDRPNRSELSWVGVESHCSCLDPGWISTGEKAQILTNTLKIPWHENFTFYAPPVARNFVGCKTSTRHSAPPLKKRSSDAPFWNFPRMSSYKARCPLPFLCLASPENLARQWDTTMRAPHVCVWLHTL
jgi:hypothetical protein